MENNDYPKKHQRGSSPHESIEEVYRSWLKRPQKKGLKATDPEAQAKERTDNTPVSGKKES